MQSDKVWIYIFRVEQYVERTKQRIGEMNPIKLMEGEKGWDVLLPREQVKDMIAVLPDKKFPRFVIGNKNFPRPKDDDRGDRRPRDRDYRGDKDSRNYRDNRDRDRDFESDSIKKKYVEKDRDGRDRR